ncbi:FtsX-like permease family protein [Streptomyces sp. XD-27]|uniref:FtsX-like permease family protein n=1 Tax=Streptomyces sp. XD-27 TaxID=3062779 RepID=UPI0026F47517|nr:ABC transporter permease [Streptomyces sp. XD-27]WKX71957.1 ABC transporter permease [Streptomyces sp. XD-27]
MWRWSWHTWRRAGLSLRGTAPLLAAMTALLALCAGTAAGAAAAVERDVLTTGGLTQIELASFEGSDSVRKLSTANLREAAKVPGVTRVSADYVSSIHTADSAEKAPTFLLQTHTLGLEDDLPMVKGELPRDRKLKPGQVILPKTSQGVDYSAYVGRTLPAAYTKATGPDSGSSAEMNLKVVGVYDPSWQADGPDAAYLAEDTAAALAAARSMQPADKYKATEGAQSAIVAVTRQNQVREVTAALQKLDFSASPVSDRVRNLPGLFGAADLVARWAVVLLAAIAVAIGAVRAKDSVRSRLGQFAVLRVLGAGVRDLKGVLLGESLLTGAVAALTGAVAGVAGSALLSGQFSDLLGLPVSAADAVPGPGWLVLALLLPAAGLLAGTWLGARFALREDPYLVVRRHG